MQTSDSIQVSEVAKSETIGSLVDQVASTIRSISHLRERLEKIANAICPPIPRPVGESGTENSVEDGALFPRLQRCRSDLTAQLDALAEEIKRIEESL